jgi:hypothetical protein
VVDQDFAGIGYHLLMEAAGQDILDHVAYFKQDSGGS